MSHDGHFIERCRGCKGIMRSCKCMYPDKEERLGICTACAAREAIPPSATSSPEWIEKGPGWYTSERYGIVIYETHQPALKGWRSYPRTKDGEQLLGRWGCETAEEAITACVAAVLGREAALAAPPPPPSWRERVIPIAPAAAIGLSCSDDETIPGSVATRPCSWLPVQARVEGWSVTYQCARHR